MVLVLVAIHFIESISPIAVSPKRFSNMYFKAITVREHFIGLLKRHDGDQAGVIALFPYANIVGTGAMLRNLRRYVHGRLP